MATPVTIQATGKRWKMQQMIGTACALVGVGLCVFAGQEGGEQAMRTYGFTGATLLCFGLVWFVVARVGAWWQHG